MLPYYLVLYIQKSLSWGGGRTGQRGGRRGHLGKTLILTGELCSWTRFSLAEILVLSGTAGAGVMAPPISTRISVRLKRVTGGKHSSPVNVHPR